MKHLPLLQRSLLLGLGLLMSGLACAHTVTDLAGRKVDVPDKVSHILLGEGRMIYSLSLLEGKNPFTRIAGWQGDFRGLDVQGYAAFQKHFPEADNVPGRRHFRRDLQRGKSPGGAPGPGDHGLERRPWPEPRQ